MSRLVLPALLALAGCYSPAIGNGQLPCSPSLVCPQGFACQADDRCWRAGSGPDLAAVADLARGDLPPGDGMPDLSIPDLAADDQASPGDLAGSDLAGRDLAGPRDLTVPRDLSVADRADLANGDK